MHYAVVITAGPRNFSAYVPDLPGCVAMGRTMDEVRENIRGAIDMHLHAMMEGGDPLPAFDSYGETIEVSQPAIVA